MNRKPKGQIVSAFGSQIEAARELGISETRLSRLIRGHNEPTPEERRKLSALRKNRGHQEQEAAV